MEINTIYWDVGAVLFSEAQISRPEFKPVLDLLNMTPQRSDTIFDHMWPKISVGDMTEDEYWKAFIEPSNKTTIPEIKTLYRSCIKTNDELFGTTRKLSSKYSQYILSNHCREWMDYLVEHYHLYKYFKDIFCSGYVKAKKPDRSFFEYALKTSDGDPSRILYIDDNQTNLNVATTLGIKGLLYEGYLAPIPPGFITSLQNALS